MDRRRRQRRRGRRPGPAEAPELETLKRSSERTVRAPPPHRGRRRTRRERIGARGGRGETRLVRAGGARGPADGAGEGGERHVSRGGAVRMEGKS